MTAIRIGGDVKPVIVASPRYLSQHPRIDEPGDLTRHSIVACTDFGREAWVFPPAKGGSIPRSVPFKPRLTVNSVRAALGAAVAGAGRHASAHLSCGRARAGRLAGTPPARRRAAGPPGQSGAAAGPLLGSQGPRVPGLRGAAPARRLRPALGRVNRDAQLKWEAFFHLREECLPNDAYSADPRNLQNDPHQARRAGQRPFRSLSKTRGSS
jgi:hypothetical protein